jgi:hypothetical protein
MKAHVAFSSLLDAARALKPYTTPARRHIHARLLHLHTDGPILTLSATTGDETATVPLDGAAGDGWCALPPDTLIKALTAGSPGGRKATTATVTLDCDDGRLTLTVTDRPTVGLDTTTGGLPPTVTTQPSPVERPVTAGPVADWHDLIAGVATAASGDPARPDLAVVRLLRDHLHVVLMAEAIDRHRIHRGSWGHPDGDPVDLRLPAAPTRRALDPHGHLQVHADDTHVYWRTDRVRLAVATRTGTFPQPGEDPRRRPRRGHQHPHHRPRRPTRRRDHRTATRHHQPPATAAPAPGRHRRADGGAPRRLRRTRVHHAGRRTARGRTGAHPDPRPDVRP